jgi:hypothetical protein
MAALPGQGRSADMAAKHEPALDAATLRERATQCLTLAEKVPSWVNAETLRRIARDYLQMAERLEQAELIEGRRPGTA